MQVRCPKCNACYELDDSIVSNKQRKLRCSNCKEIFVAEDLFVKSAEKLNETVKFSDVIDEDIQTSNEDVNIEIEQKLEEEAPSQDDIESEENQNSANVSEEQDVKEVIDAQSDENQANNEDDTIDLEAIFARLSEHTESLIVREKKLPIHEKIWFQIKNVLGFHFKIKWTYVFIGCLIFVLLSAYNNRYQIVRTVPFLNSVYKAFGIKAKIPGEGLEFANISWDFLSEGEGTKLEIKGFINNTTQKEIVIPRVHIEILDKNTVLLQSQNRKMKEDRKDDS